ncbi:type II toxin-antitoxin system VapC family toxin [Ancrocorticia populi]|uniref:Ribonuclease VapC n=1 Tax=Ancrocorticia populi TaxID=2175228 RepID=A0A2V1K868_9ACTO|nr:type II toxin-antitoxin system VapC family toxin [Ancrocorticia populi]PWF26531.1 VapC toxin family PIN domain ribonuclease [Ancrocorticia populi]
MSRLVYADTSALAKLLAEEAETLALRSWIAGIEDLVMVSSDLVRTELMRAIRKAHPAAAPSVRALLTTLVLVPISTDICDSAARLEPPTLRSLDAIHLATALVAGEDLEAMLTYDDRLAEASSRYGLKVVAPSA